MKYNNPLCLDLYLVGLKIDHIAVPTMYNDTRDKFLLTKLQICDKVIIKCANVKKTNKALKEKLLLFI